jgi:ferredoxin
VTYKFLSIEDLSALVAELVAAGTRVLAPVRAKDDARQLDYLPIRTLADAALNVALPRRSLKEFFLPPSEVLLSYKQTKAGVEIKEVPTKAKPQVILGASPCDAAALETVDKVMNWEYRDELWFGRREATTIVSFLCSVMDSSCFCTSVGLGPDSLRGSDVLLTPVAGGYLAQVITAKGEALLQGHGSEDSNHAAEAEAAKLQARGKVEKNLPTVPADFADWLAKNFNHETWKTMALRCHGCGACASICPTCHCFDIVDEHKSSEEGERRRNWDSCQTSKFTLHSSGHNPRGSQSERFRQRIQHKFSIYPSRFGEILCTGCGRCSRICPGGMNLPEILGELIALDKNDSEKSGESAQ